jgi:hypothetical protein
MILLSKYLENKNEIQEVKHIEFLKSLNRLTDEEAL